MSKKDKKLTINILINFTRKFLFGCFEILKRSAIDLRAKSIEYVFAFQFLRERKVQNIGCLLNDF